MTTRLLVLLLLFARPAAAQMVPHQMPITVQADRIMIGTEFVPRCLTMPQVLAVPAGKTVEPPADGTFDCVEVAGTLKFSRSRDTVLKVTHLFVLPGGVLDMGTEANPLPADRRIELIIRDVPIDTGRDPFQWGNGFLNFARRDCWGAPKLAWTTLTTGVAAAQTTVTLSEDPQGWRVGDELLFPDMDIPDARGPRRERSVTVASLSGRTITLSKPLDHDHFAQVDPDGNIVTLPYVANLTRNIVIRSENPNGTRGHGADVGHDATWREGYIEFVGLGRSPAEPLDSTTSDRGTITHIGTKQVGRYGGGHKHHANGFGSKSVGNVYKGLGSAPSSPKWAFALHGVSDALVERNVCLDFAGSCFVTEDGYEVRNTFLKNFAAYTLGNANGSDIAERNIERNAPGIEGNGFWWRGTVQTFEGNVAINNSVGMNLFNVRQLPGHYPSVPGGKLDTVFQQRTAIPVLMRNNVTASNVVIGLEYWGSSRFPNTGHLSSYNRSAQFFAVISNNQRPYLVNPLFVSKEGRSGCVFTNAAYTNSLDIEGGRVVGCGVGIMSGGALEHIRIIGTEFQNAINIDFSFPFPEGAVLEHINVMHRELPGFPKQYIVFGKGEVLPPGSPLPKIPASRWLAQQGSRFLLTNWQGTGQNFRLFEPQQLENTACWPAAALNQHQWNSPVAGLTMGQCWDRFGMAYGGEVLRAADAVPLEGVINGLAAKGLTPTLGPPRFIVTFPPEHRAADVEVAGGTPVINFHGVITGSQVGTQEGSHVSIDGGPAFFVGANGVRRDLRVFQAKGAAATAEGRHEIKTWRLNTSGKVIPSSEMVFHYSVGRVATQPPPPPAPPPPPTPLESSRRNL